MNKAKASSRDALVETAREILSGTNFLTAVRAIVALRFETSFPDDQVFVPFISFVSDSDDQPGVDQRALYEPEALDEKDSVLQEQVAFARAEIEAACHELIARLE